ncbi:MAG: glycosyltransferase family 2 protein [Elusimicrobia bacterium]|nr:glycosyltransferase family 2 protein [Elusimicrobiota bacterium]
MSLPRVSVVIPAYNAASFIETTLDSIRAQTFTDYEVVVVDDGSQDGTHRVAEAYLSGHRLEGRVIRQENKKIAGARNTGMRAAAGEFIALLDHDDLWRPDKLALVMREFELHPETGLVGHHIAVTKDGAVVRVIRKGPAAARMYERLLLEGNAVSPSAAVFRKDRALAIGGFREELEYVTVEDYDFWMRLSKVAPFRFIDRILSEYPLRETSASARIGFHHRNLETLLRRHFLEHFGPTPGLLDRLRMRRRMAAAFRSALGRLLETDGPAEEARDYALRMLSEYPLDPKNLARACQWALRRLES